MHWRSKKELQALTETAFSIKADRLRNANKVCKGTINIFYILLEQAENIYKGRCKTIILESRFVELSITHTHTHTHTLDTHLHT